MNRIFLLIVCFLFCGVNFAFAAERIIFVPLDTRPITSRDTAIVAEKAGIKVLMPPAEILGTEKNPGDPAKLWNWLERTAPTANAAVLSTDSMIYGSLVASRKHTLTESEAQNQVLRFKKLKEKYPNLKMYAYGTILRTLLSQTHSAGGMEPAIYQANAVKIYNYSALLDKREMGIATRREVREFNRLKAEINPEVMEDWSSRHAVNMTANEKLIDLTKEGVFSFFLLGGDDSAVYSATHREARLLKQYADENNVERTTLQILSGADELGMLMLSRAVLDMKGEIPFVHIIYNNGKGKDTLPKYSFETVGNDMKAEILALGAMEVPNPTRADITLLINTAINGKTLDANSAVVNKKRENASVRSFIKKIKDATDKGYKNIAVGDITFGNGSDNSLMEAMRKNNLQFKINAYAGWNTATNTLGFVFGEAALLNYMTEKSQKELMLYRYLDEWAYQANIRQELIAAYPMLKGETDPTGATLGTKQEAAEEFVTEKMKAFAKENVILPSNLSLSNLKVTLPWKRFFECKIEF